MSDVANTIRDLLGCRVDRDTIIATLDAVEVPPYEHDVCHFQKYLSAFVRLVEWPEKPVFVEVGIGYALDRHHGPVNGQSTWALLEGCQTAHLYSIDICYDDAEHMRYNVARTRYNGVQPPAFFRWTPLAQDAVSGMRKVVERSALRWPRADYGWDLFLHDGDHDVMAQTFEYELAWRYLKPGGWLLSDDYTWGLPEHGAWRNFLARHGNPPMRALGACAIVQKPLNLPVALPGNVDFHIAECILLALAAKRAYEGHVYPDEGKK